MGREYLYRGHTQKPGSSNYVTCSSGIGWLAFEIEKERIAIRLKDIPIVDSLPEPYKGNCVFLSTEERFYIAV